MNMEETTRESNQRSTTSLEGWVDKWKLASLVNMPVEHALFPARCAQYATKPHKIKEYADAGELMYWFEDDDPLTKKTKLSENSSDIKGTREIKGAALNKLGDSMLEIQMDFGSSSRPLKALEDGVPEVKKEGEIQEQIKAEICKWSTALVKQEGQWSSAVKESKQILTRLETVVAQRKPHLSSCIGEYQKRVQEGNEHADKLISICNKTFEEKQETVDEMKGTVETSETMLTEFKVVVKEMKGLLS
jgi:hypothetical protein